MGDNFLSSLEAEGKESGQVGKARDVWLWPADDVVPEEEAWNNPRYLTEVVTSFAKPKIGSLLVGIGYRGFPSDRHGAFAVGIVKAIQPVATHKVRLRIEPIATFAAIPLDRLMPGWAPSESEMLPTEDDNERDFPPWEDAKDRAP